MSYAGTTPKFESSEFDNIKIEDNTISSTNTDGDINLSPDGAGKVTVPTLPAGDNSNSAASTSYADNAATQAASSINSTIQSQITVIEGNISDNQSDISNLQSADLTFVKKDGSVAMEADLSLFDGATHHKVTGLADPVNPRDAVNKQTLDAVSGGILPRPAVKAATTVNLAATYDNGVADDGVGATLNLGPLATLDIDGITSWVQFDGILIKDQTASLQNGRYFVSQVGDGVTDWILTRCGTCDESDEMPASYMFVQFGTENAGEGYVALVGTSAGSDPNAFEIGYDDITFTQFAGGDAYTFGDGVQLVGNEISAKVDGTTITIDGSGNLQSPLPASVAVPALDIDWSAGNLFYKDVAANSTLTFSNLQDGKTISVAIRNTSGADVTITLPTVIKSADFSALVKASNKETVFTFMYMNSKVYASSVGDMS